MKATAGEHWIPTVRGRLHARVWSPTGDAAAAVPIVLFHDSLGCVELWRDFPDHLAGATGRAVVAYDRLGFGRSDPHPGTLPVSFVHDEAETCVSSVCRVLGIDAFVPFGHSVGGGMAVATAAHAPARCAALITESAQAFVEQLTLDGIRAAQATFSRPEQVERLQRYHGTKARWVLDAWIDTWLSPAFAAWTLDEDLARVRCPLLAIHGDRDEYGSPEHPARIARLAGGPAIARVLAGCGHVPHREQPERVLAAVVAFLAGAPSAGG